MARKRRRIVLIHPPQLTLLSGATPSYVDRNRGHMPPLGLLYLQAALEHSPHDPIFFDAALEGWDHDETARHALSHNPDVIGLQAMTFTMADAYLTVRAVKRLNPHVYIVIGGPHPTIYPCETAALEGVDFAFEGEGEQGLPLLLDVLDKPECWSTVPGLAFKRNGEICHVPSTGLLKNLDQVFYPARRSSRYKEYGCVLAKHGPVTTMITSRGCPFNCVFCNRMGRKYRWHSAEYVLGEIEEILNLGICEIFIHDDIFTLRRERVEAICHGIIERGYEVTWEARTRVDCVDEAMLALMRKAGCVRLSFGVESGSEKVLKSMRKGIDLKRVEQVFEWCRKEGIVTLADFMIGNLDEEKEDLQKTFDLVRRLRPDYVQYSICSPYPGTPLYELGLKTGLIGSDLWLEFAKNPLQKFTPPVWTQHFTEKELVEITTKAYRAFYYRPSFVMKQLVRIRSFSQLKNMAAAALGMLR